MPLTVASWWVCTANILFFWDASCSFWRWQSTRLPYIVTFCSANSVLCLVWIAKCFWDQKATLPVYHVVIGSCRMRGSHYVTWKKALTQSSCILMNLIPKERERVHRTQILFHSTKYMNVLHHVFRCVTSYTMVGYSDKTLIKRFQRVAAICSSWSDQCHWDAMATEIQAWYSPCVFCLKNTQINTGIISQKEPAGRQGVILLTYKYFGHQSH